MRRLKLLVLLLLPIVAGCTAMMVGGGATYEPPAEECADGESEKQCES